MRILTIEDVVKFEVSSKIYEQIKILPLCYDYAGCLEETEDELAVRKGSLIDKQKTLEAIVAIALHELANRILHTKAKLKIWDDERFKLFVTARVTIRELESDDNLSEAYWQTIDLLGEIFSYLSKLEQRTEPITTYVIAKKV